MNGDIEKLVSEYESGHMSRRKLVGSLTGLMVMLAGGASAFGTQDKEHPASENKLKSTSQDRKPFEEIARKKGVPIHFDAAGTVGTAEAKIQSNEKNIHLDMDMVEESMRSAIQWTGKNGQTMTKSKLERLLASGSDAQKVEFVLGSGKYYFPEDLENIAKLSRLSGGRELSVDCRTVCQTVWYMLCRCTGNAQWCRDESREVCHLVCG